AALTRFQVVYPSERLELDVANDLPAIIGDAALLRRVIDNLVDNARKYSEPKSSVTLRMERQGEHVVISVIDRGMGIAAADLPAIFPPFFRADRSRTRKTGGVGMGLALVRRIVSAHAGEIEVTSEVGQGTEVRVRMPSSLPAAATTSREHFRT